MITTKTMKKLLLLAALSFAAPAYAGPYEQGYAGGALYAATCAVVKGKTTKTGATAILAAVLKKEGVSLSYVSDPVAQQIASAIYVRNGGCR